MPAKKLPDSAVELIGEIEEKIYVIRGKRVMLDSDLASLYKVETRVLNQAVKRNMKRFPPDFVFQLDENEVTELRNSSQIVMSSNLLSDAGARMVSQTVIASPSLRPRAGT